MKYTLAFILILFININAQDSIQDSILGSDTEKKDTICFKYDFYPGDTLEYRLEAHDSIIVDWDTAIVKARYEKVRIVCEDFNKKTSTYLLSQETYDYIAYESKGDLRDIERVNHPWINRKVYFEIDSLGNRLEYYSDDSTKVSTNPGSYFQPFLIVPITESCKEIDESWINYRDTTFVIENGVPAPLFLLTDLFRNKGYKDTLDRITKHLSFVRTSKGIVSPENKNVIVNSRINSDNQLLLDSALNIPVYYYANQEQKFGVIMPNDNRKNGTHFNHSFYTLDRFVPSSKRDN